MNFKTFLRKLNSIHVLLFENLNFTYFQKALVCSSHLDMLGALQQPLVQIPCVVKLFLLDLKVDVGLPQHLKSSTK